MLIESDGVLKTEQELEEQAAAQAEAEANAPPPELIALQVQQQATQMQAETQRMVAEMRRETELLRYATQQNIVVETTMARLQGLREQISSDERKMAAEVAVDGRKEPGQSTAGGYV